MPRFAPPSLTAAQLTANTPGPIYVGEMARASDTGHIWSAYFVGEELSWRPAFVFEDHTLANLRDVELAGLGANQTIAFNNTTGVWRPWSYATTAQGTKADTAVQPARSIVTTAPLTGGGNLEVDRILAISAATQAAAGSMSAVDKLRLDAIEDAATQDQTAQEIVAAIDADTVAEAALKTVLDLGSAAYTPTTDYATAAQGGLADTAIQPTRSIGTSAPLTGGGDLSVNRTLGISAATTTTDGSMSSADKLKLDGIETAATADQTAAEVVALIDADTIAEEMLKNALGLGSAAYTAADAYATLAQGELADTALQVDNIINALDSTDIAKPLSAAQGKVLADQIGDISAALDVINGI